jgi:hypothetical protein
MTSAETPLSSVAKLPVFVSWVPVTLKTGAPSSVPIDEIKKAEQHEAFKQTLLRLLDDPQVQQKIVSLLLYRFGKDPAKNPLAFRRDRDRSLRNW